MCRFPVLGKVEITDADLRGAIVSALKQGAKTRHPMAACYKPRHVIRAEKGGRTVDVVICFECGNYRVHRAEDGKLVGGGRMSRVGEALLNKLLTDAGVPIAP